MDSGTSADPDSAVATELTVSGIFNETTGDFALISSDQTIFYVPRKVLQYSSEVFENMFEIGTPSSEDNAPIQM